MRKPLLLALCIVLIQQAAALAQPSPATSVCVLAPSPLPCQYRFRADGGLDNLSLAVALRDAAGAPVPGWPVTCALVPNAGTVTFCSCCPNPQAGLTNALGIIVFTWSKIGGRGTLDVEGAPVGTADDVVRVIHDYFAAGVETLIIGSPTADLASLDRLCNDVLPRLDR